MKELLPWINHITLLISWAVCVCVCVYAGEKSSVRLLVALKCSHAVEVYPVSVAWLTFPCLSLLPSFKAMNIHAFFSATLF